MPVAKPFIRDGIDVFLRDQGEVHFVFLATRARITLRIRPALAQSLTWLDGRSTRESLVERIRELHGAGAGPQFEALLSYLEDRGIVVDPDWLVLSGLSDHTIATQGRQLAFMLDVLGTPEQAIAAQRRIENARLVCFGVGAVGSWLVRQLIGVGFRRFILVDHDIVNASDVTRHAFINRQDMSSGIRKVDAAASVLRKHFSHIEVHVFPEALSTSVDLESFIPTDTSIVINAADQPYIGYTSVLLSRFCVSRRIPLLVAGGFDAHLGCIGEMIVPGITPCADCYAEHFSESLKDWVPVQHPVAERREAHGGLCSMSVFSAGTAAMQILRLFMGDGAPRGGRGELMFDTYNLETFDVARRANCSICANL